MKPQELTLYRDLLGDIKTRVRQAQHRAALSANAEMIAMYWDIGRMIAARQKKEGWGAGVIPRLAMDLKNELPEQKGFSESNLKRMVQFNLEYPGLTENGAQPAPQLPESKASPENRPPSVTRIGAQAAPQPISPAAIVPQPAALMSIPSSVLLGIPWFHNVILIQKLKDFPTRFWYARQALEQGWSRDTLTIQIKNRAHERQGTAITNFATTLPEAHAALAQGLLKDPYLFDFLTMAEPFHERELETSLVQHIQQFLIELGQGFSFVGRQYRLEISDRDFYLDLLFYHLHLRCFIVVDLKKGEFKPEYAGKMNFYCSAVDDLLRHEHDAPTIGLILCQTKDRIFAEYALRDVHKPIGLAEYEFTRALPQEFVSSLPSIEDIESVLSEEITKEDSK